MQVVCKFCRYSIQDIWNPGLFWQVEIKKVNFAESYLILPGTLGIRRTAGKYKRKQLPLEHRNDCLVDLCCEDTHSPIQDNSRHLQMFLISCLCFEEVSAEIFYPPILEIKHNTNKILCKCHNLISSWHRE